MAALARAIYQKWSAVKSSRVGINTPVGTITIVDADCLIFDAGAQSTAWPVLVLKRELKPGGETWFVNKEGSQGGVDQAVTICIAMTQYFAGQDFQTKLSGSIALMKRVARAIKGE